MTLGGTFHRDVHRIDASWSTLRPWVAIVTHVREGRPDRVWSKRHWTKDRADLWAAWAERVMAHGTERRDKR